MKISTASKKVLASALSAAMVVAFAPTVAFGAEVTQDKGVVSVKTSTGLTHYYPTLAEGLAAAAAGDTVTLMQDVAVTEDDTLATPNTVGTISNAVAGGVTFNGDGHSITGLNDDFGITFNSGTATQPTVIMGVTAAVKSTTKAKYKATFTVAGDGNAAASTNYATVSGVTVDDLTVNDTNDLVKATVVNTTVNKTLTDNEETTVKSGSAKAVTSNGATTIEDGTYESVANSDGTVTIKGGKFSGGMSDEHEYQYALSNTVNATEVDAAVVTIKGGEFSGYINNGAVKYYKAKNLVYDTTQYSTKKNDTSSNVAAEKTATTVYATISSGTTTPTGNIGGTPTPLNDKYVYDTTKTYYNGGDEADLSTLSTNVVYYKTASADNEAILVSGGTFVDDPTAWLDKNVSAGQDEATKIWSVGTGVTSNSAIFDNDKISIGTGDLQTEAELKAAKKVVAAATSAWLAAIKDLKMPAELTFNKANATKNVADLYSAVMAAGAQTTVSYGVAAQADYGDVKDVTAASPEALVAAKASYDKIEAAAAAAKLTTIKDITKAYATQHKQTQYTNFYTIAADFSGMCDVSSLGAGNEVTYYFDNDAINDYSDNYAYSMVFEDGTIVPGTVEAAVTGTGTHDKRIAFKTAKTGNFTLAYTDTVADTKAELAELQKQLDELKAQQDADKATIVALQDEIAAKSAAGKSKTVKLNGKSKTTKKQTVTLKAVASDSGATMAFKKTSGSSKVSVAKSGKATLKKGVKKGTYTAKVKATVGASSKTVTVKFVVKK